MPSYQRMLYFLLEALLVGAAATALTVWALGTGRVPASAFVAVATLHFVRKVVTARLRGRSSNAGR